MIFIVDNTIMTSLSNGDEYFEVINDTGYLPVCIYTNIVLMSNGKLYIVEKWTNYELFELEMAPEENYVVNHDDFTNTFVKINSDWYKNIFVEINSDCDEIILELHKIPIVAKKSSDIVDKFNSAGYYYIDTENNLVSYCTQNESHTILETNVDSLLFCNIDFVPRLDTIVYKKADAIVCSRCDGLSISNSYIINHDGSPIIKMIDRFVLFFDRRMCKFLFAGGACAILKLLDNVTDFNYNPRTSELYVVDNENRMSPINIYNHKVTHTNFIGRFAKINNNNIKSARNLCKSTC